MGMATDGESHGDHQPEIANRRIATDGIPDRVHGDDTPPTHVAAVDSTVKPPVPSPAVESIGGASPGLAPSGDLPASPAKESLVAPQAPLAVDHEPTVIEDLPDLDESRARVMTSSVLTGGDESPSSLPADDGELARAHEYIAALEAALAEAISAGPDPSPALNNNATDHDSVADGGVTGSRGGDGEEDGAATVQAAPASADVVALIAERDAVALERDTLLAQKNTLLAQLETMGAMRDGLVTELQAAKTRVDELERTLEADHGTPVPAPSSAGLPPPITAVRTRDPYASHPKHRVPPQQVPGATYRTPPFATGSASRLCLCLSTAANTPLPPAFCSLGHRAHCDGDQGNSAVGACGAPTQD